MATVTGLTAARMLEIEGDSIVSGYIDELGHLILVSKIGNQSDAGPISAFTATEEAEGSVELATAAETQEGTDNQRAVTPAGLFSVLGSVQGFRYYGMTIFTSSGSFNKSDYPGIKAVRVRVSGAGGGGGGAGAAPTGGNHSAGGGGGGGGYSERIIDESVLNATETVTVGAGGVGGVGTGTGIGSAGGTSSFGAHAVATGGAGGSSFANNPLMVGAVGGDGGVGSSTDADAIVLKGDSGAIGNGYATLGHGGRGGSSFLGGAGYGAYTPSGGGQGTGGAGGTYGGGGGGATSNSGGAARDGGIGAQGVVIVEVYV